MQAWNVLLPDRSRGDLRNSMAGWRRFSEPLGMWIYGQLVISESDITFLDEKKPWAYTPPELGPVPNLEADLARSKDFVAALRDDAFALTAFSRLCYLDWMKVGHREVETFNGNGDVAEMIAGLRDKGENYLDIENECLSGRDEPPRGSHSEDQVRRFHFELEKIGWRTHTTDEVRSAIREALKKRLKDRVTLLRRVKELELRPEQHCQRWIDRPPHRPLAMPFYEGDDAAWIEPLSREEQDAVSAETSVRLYNLAITARLSEDEYRSLQPLLGWGPLFFNARRSDSTDEAH